MAVYFTSLNSGSNGNCYYIGNDAEAVLIDAGLSCKETERRMHSIGLDIKKVKAIFVSHEHIDHVRGLAGLADKYGMPVYVTPNTQEGCYHLHPKHAVPFIENSTTQIGALHVTAFLKQHDAADPHSFIIESDGLTIGVFTDIGSACKNVHAAFKKCNAAFLEANYDSNMLANGRYPTFLQQRISGDKGHLSNDQALHIFKHHKPSFMSHLLLAHLSKDNNCPLLVKKLFEKDAGKTKIYVASRDEAMAVMFIENKNTLIKSMLKKHNTATQLSIF